MNHQHRLPDDTLSRALHPGLVRAFDYVAAASFGAVGALAAWAVVPASQPMVVEMLLGMGMGVVTALPLLALFLWILGGFEIVILSMQVGMFAGMVGAMTTSLGLGDVAFEGVLVGLIVQSIIHAMDRSLAGDV